MVLTFRPLPGRLGSEVRSIDLSLPIAPTLRDQLVLALAEHQILVARDQELGDEQFLAIASCFGQLERYEGKQGRLDALASISNLDSTGRPSATKALGGSVRWHADKSYRPIPPSVTALYAIAVPAFGGNTEFSDMRRAFAMLSDAQQKSIMGLRVIHSQETVRREFGLLSRAGEACCEQPLVHWHPSLDANCLLLGMYCSSIVGMAHAEGRKILGCLETHATQACLVYSHQWRKGDLVVWDNRSLLHRGRPDYDLKHDARILKRACVEGRASFQPGRPSKH